MDNMLHYFTAAIPTAVAVFDFEHIIEPIGIFVHPKLVRLDIPVFFTASLITSEANVPSSE